MNYFFSNRFGPLNLQALTQASFGCLFIKPAYNHLSDKFLSELSLPKE